MNILLGFGGRIGRLHYFLLSLLLGVVMAVLVFSLLAALMPQHGTGGTMPKKPSSGLVLTIAVIVMPIFLWFSFALQAKRFRDIGWNPLYAILGWIGVGVVDRCVAFLVPALAFGDGSGTLAGVLTNLFMVGCLLFWPGTVGGSDPDYHRIDTPPAGPVARPFVSPMPTAAPAPTLSGFGRRRQI